MEFCACMTLTALWLTQCARGQVWPLQGEWQREVGPVSADMDGLCGSGSAILSKAYIQLIHHMKYNLILKAQSW